MYKINFPTSHPCFSWAQDRPLGRFPEAKPTNTVNMVHTLTPSYSWLSLHRSHFVTLGNTITWHSCQVTGSLPLFYEPKAMINDVVAKQHINLKSRATIMRFKFLIICFIICFSRIVDIMVCWLVCWRGRWSLG